MTDARDADGRRCIKCGREIGPEESICAICNRAGMAAPSASQYHGTIVAAIVLAVAGLAVAASLSLRGVGPYGARLVAVEPADPGYAITYEVTNQGSRPGRAKCELVALGTSGERLRSVRTVTEQIPGGISVTQVEEVPGLDTEPTEVAVSCS